MSPDKEYMSLEEVADLLGVNYQLIYKLVRSGEIPASRVGKVYRVSRSDLDHYLEQSKSSATGGVCSACGRTYQSRLSLTQQCKVCEAPICADCWDRQHVTFCAEHQQKTDKPNNQQNTAKQK